MGRIILLLLIIAALVLVWKAFGPSTWRRGITNSRTPAIKGPDDDEQFLWELDKKRFKKRREQELRNEAIRRREQDKPQAQQDPGDPEQKKPEE